MDGKVIKEGKLKMMRRCGGVLAAKSCPSLATPLTVARQAPLSMGFSRQEYWSGLPFSSPGDLPDPGIKPGSPALQADSLPTELPGKPRRYRGELKTNTGADYKRGSCKWKTAGWCLQRRMVQKSSEPLSQETMTLLLPHPW